MLLQRFKSQAYKSFCPDCRFFKLFIDDYIFLKCLSMLEARHEFTSSVIFFFLPGCSLCFQQRQRTIKHMVFYDDRQYKARDICFFEFNWSQKLSSNSIGPENLRSQNRNVDLTRLHIKISTWLHYAGFRLYVASHVSETPRKLY